MTILSASPAGSGAGGELVTVQCDICRPPWIGTNTAAHLVDANWELTLAGSEFDICPVCRRRKRRVDMVPRSRQVVASHPGSAVIPNLLIIGAAKCGTTSLHSYLARHPSISMSSVKEPQYFIDPNRRQWSDYYSGLFVADAPVRGESSTLYTRFPAIPDVPAHIASEEPNMRLIYLVRDPVERALASFIEEKMHDIDRRPVADAFADVENPFNHYISASRYAFQMKQYLAVFPKPNLLVLDMVELRQSPETALRRVFDFLQVDPSTSTTPALALNGRETKREYPSITKRLRHSVLLRSMYRLPEAPREAVLKIVRKKLSRPIDVTFDPKLRTKVEDALRQDAADLRQMTNMSFDHWSV